MYRFHCVKDISDKGNHVSETSIHVVSELWKERHHPQV